METTIYLASPVGLYLYVYGSDNILRLPGGVETVYKIKGNSVVALNAYFEARVALEAKDGDNFFSHNKSTAVAHAKTMGWPLEWWS